MPVKAGLNFNSKNLGESIIFDYKLNRSSVLIDK